jgi:NAD(P)-dependent dehydrogenase (short-subunit alcohol dehydrogenase family)
VTKSCKYLLLGLVVLSLQLAPAHAAAESQRAVLITGASTGIGRNMAETLAAEGYFVYAGARKDEDLAELDAIDNIKAVRLDVTRQDHVDAAVALVRAEGRGLWGLVNNAGVAISGPVANLGDDDLEFLFGVNVNGVVRVTREFIPLITESKGRIVTTGSISGILSSGRLPAYSMSKHAMEAFTDSLAAELEPHGVAVSVIEPGNYKSRIRRTASSRVASAIEAEGGDVPEDVQEQIKDMAAYEVELKEPDEVSAALLHAMSATAPLRRYMVVPNEREADITIRKAIEELVQLNAWGPYSYSRDELVKILDEKLAAQ